MTNPLTDEDLKAIHERHKKRMKEQLEWNIPSDARDIDMADLLDEIERLRAKVPHRGKVS